VSWKFSSCSNADQLLAAPISNCFNAEKALSVLLCFAVPLTLLLFFFRACAVFGMNPFAVAIFGVLWLCVLGGCLTTIPGIGGTNIGPTPYCMSGPEFKLYSVAASITPLIFDGIVFFAISWRLWRNTWARRTVKNSVRVLVFGDYLPAFSRSLLQDGQIYFLSVFLILSATLVDSIFHRTSVSANLLAVVMASSTSVPGPYRTLFSVPNVAVTNIMACRVYRRRIALRGPKEQQSSDSNPTVRRTSTTDNLTVNVNTMVETLV
jgi:hypothetical protein